jgi:hypothetical protein
MLSKTFNLFKFILFHFSNVLIFCCNKAFSLIADT